MLEYIQIHPNDNVVVALRDYQQGEMITLDTPTAFQQQITVTEDIARGHKIALQPIEINQHIIKYGYPIGHAIQPIIAGSHIHTHNAKTNLTGIEEYHYHPKTLFNPYTLENRTFQGYRRSNGDVGIRNELWIVPTVGCVNGIAELILSEFQREVGDIAPFENTLVLKHSYGCSQLGDDHQYTRTILADAVKHPNVGGVLVLGLGCENNEMDQFKVAIGEYDEHRVKFLVSQMVSDEVEAGVQLLKEIFAHVQGDHREDIPLSDLKIGLKCGGSDGLSGITANPLLGKLSDYMAAQGGTTVLTEVPEMFGAEQILMERAADEQVFGKIVHLINDFKQYFMDYKQPVYENPSPGNKAGGITTLEDKSLGCTQKSGISPVQDVLLYGERLQTRGLNLLSAPGNDLVASSALAAAGCQLVIFTTGRGTPFGSFVPTMKVATNSPLFANKPHWIDYNAGTLVEDVTIEDGLQDFIDYIIEVASGRWVNNEKNKFRELAIFKSGVTL
ncbi:altronate hydrolase [Paenibacillus sp. SORGH_AS306]|uniref:UxaA family hydrolase n=1 Tax=unclassified Paenibacillus TaxID=185978 RepID=UPI00278B0E9E|nr:MULTISPECIES: altronate dehydratase family protein [unclassified Paenibacillus]MDQ1235845.1 altronate hydrolase [Paenibacillus sp. SORGH_AS_0306]MDR6112895.1 altronate hydrolase [Paenibacillus sp. SORGH_AS_0338]